MRSSTNAVCYMRVCGSECIVESVPTVVHAHGIYQTCVEDAERCAVPMTGVGTLFGTLIVILFIPDSHI